MSNLFSSTKDWIFHSGLVIQDINSENLGGVHSYYDIPTQKYGFLYPEITGYFLSTIRFLRCVDPKIDVNFAKNSANWLLKIYETFGGIIQGISNNEPTHNLVYSFDTMICAKGFLDCYEITKEEKFLTFAKKLLNWLQIYALENDGTIKPFMNLENNQFQESNDVWYKQKGCLHIKSAIPFLQLYKITNEKQFLETGTKISDSIKFYKNPDGSIRLHQNKNLVHMHSLCYALEGLIYSYSVTQNDFYLKQCNETLNWCASKIENDGSSNLWYYSKNKPAKTSYHTAQIIRLMILVDKANGNNNFKKSIDKLHSFLITLQSNSQDNKIGGGFHEELFKNFLGWKIRQRINSWSSMFALQSLYLKENYDQISFEPEVNVLF